VDDFLHHEVTTGVVGQVGSFEQDLEIADMTVQVTGDEDIGCIEEVDAMAATAGRGPDQTDGLAENREHPFRCGHRGESSVAGM
jgi:hypothetical protein